ncbi:MAG: acyl carrier protein [Acidimicrobiales bacterium]
MADVVTQEAVLAELEAILLDVIGDDLLLDGPLTMATSFDQDLQLESIEFVALSERLLETYGDQVDFVGWLAEMELDEIIALTVGQLVDFVVAQANGEAAPADA